jgi:hypothetical protein
MNALNSFCASAISTGMVLIASRRVRVFALSSTFASFTDLRAHRGEHTDCIGIRGEKSLPQALQALGLGGKTLERVTLNDD